MRAILTASVAAVAIGLGTVSLLAAPADQAAKPNATPFVRLAQYGGGGDGYHGDGYHEHHYCHRHKVCDSYGYHCHWVCD
jgi:hypothetical protein